MTTNLATVYDQLEFQALSWPDRAAAVRVVDQAGYEAGATLLGEIKALRAEIAAACDPVIAAAHAAHKAATTQKRELEAPLVEAESAIKSSMATWYDAEQRRIRELEQRQLEAARLAEESSRLDEAAALEEAGENDAAHALLDAPSFVAPPTIAAPQAKGAVARTRWDVVVDDVRALCRAVADGQVPATLVEPNLTALRQMATAMREELRIPGVRAVSKVQIAGQRAR